MTSWRAICFITVDTIDGSMCGHSAVARLNNHSKLHALTGKFQITVMQGRSYIQAIEAYASLNKLKSKPSTQIMVLM